MTDFDPETLLLGLVALMRKHGSAATRTRLMKFLYLADLQHARYADGETLTGWQWRVNAFGPCASEALGLLDSCVGKGHLQTWDLGSQDDEDVDRRAIGYNATGDIDRLVAGLPAKIIGRMTKWVKAYGDSTPRLLRFVYGDTEPMRGAQDGDILDFTSARPFSATTLPASPIDSKTRRRMEQLMRKVHEQYAASVEAASAGADGPYDDEYRRGVPLDEQLVEGDVMMEFGTSSDPHGRS